MEDSLEGYGPRLLEALKAAVGGTMEQRQALIKEVGFGATHYDALDEHTRLLVERVGTLVMDSLSENVRSMPRSPEQRTLQRSLDLAKGVHYTVRGIFDSLERAPARLPDFALSGEALCLATVQEVADLVHDLNERVTQGNDILAFAGLITECIQESLFGLHAARHGFPGQALAHCRAVYEDLDLLALFRRDTDARDLWVSGDGDQIRKKLAPFKVRELLGRTGKDIPYKFYSEFGTHTSVLSVAARSRFVAPSDDGEHPRMEILVTGTWERDALLPAHMALCFQTHHLLLEAIGWSQHLKTGLDENRGRVDRMMEQRAEFMRTFVAPWMQEKGYPEAAIRAMADPPQESGS